MQPSNQKGSLHNLQGGFCSKGLLPQIQKGHIRCHECHRTPGQSKCIFLKSPDLQGGFQVGKC